MDSALHRRLPRESLQGAGYAVLAYGAWGLSPIYWKWVQSVPPLQMVSYRILWSLPVLLALVARGGRGAALRAALTSTDALKRLATTSMLICGNWLVFIWAVQADRVLDASLGYYINPLLNVALGTLVLRERLRWWQGVAVAIASVGVLNLTLGLGSLPWVSLLLASSFACYGLLRKTGPIDGLVGLTVEVLLLSPLAVAYLVWAELRGTGVLTSLAPQLLAAVPISGLVTALPLLWFANGARRLSYATLGLLQYLAPTGHFLLAVAAYGEAFTSAHGITFGCIWLALGIYSVDSLRTMRRVGRRGPVACT